MSDIKYAFYHSSKGFKVVGGTAAQFLKADGSVDTNSYLPYSGAVSDLSLGDKNLNFTGGSISRFENACRIFNKVYQKHTAAAQTGILSVKFPQASPSATMLDVTLKIYGYQNKILGSIRVSFYKFSATAINANGAKAVMECSETFPTNIINVGIDSTGNVAINIGDSSTIWNSYLTVEVERVAAQYTGSNFDWSKGWAQTIEIDTSGYQSILNIVPDVIATRSWATTNMAGYWKKDDVGSYWRLDSNKDVAVLNGTQAQRLLSGGLLASNAYADIINIPVNGIYSKGMINTGSHGDSAKWYTAFGWGNHANAGYMTAAQVNANFAARDGSNATSNWRNAAYGLVNNPSIPDRIKNGSGNSDLINATYGDVLGMINSPGTDLGNPTGDWYHRIKMLHQNSAGYYTEIAVQMTGGNTLWFRRFEEGAFVGPNNGWVKVATAEELNTAVNGFVKVNESYSSIIGNDVALVDGFFNVEMGLADIVGGINIAAKVFEAYEYGTVAGGGRINCGIIIDPVSTNHGYAARPDPDEKHYFSGRVFSTEGFKTPTNSGSILLSSDGGQVAAGDSMTINSGVIDLNVGNKVVTTNYIVVNTIGKLFYVTYAGDHLGDAITLPATVAEGTRVEVMNVSATTIKVVRGTNSVTLPSNKGCSFYYNGVGWIKSQINDASYF